MMAKGNILFIVVVVVVTVLLSVDSQYVVDDSKLGREFDGIGGLSGGGATSRLLPNYNRKYLDNILDLLFKPNFAASLHILKVEIGGDGQSTDGTESSHMHTESDENYQRGYEWLLMTEAKMRNPDIKLYALSWAYPAWVGNGSGSPYKYPDITAGYIVNWIQGARHFYNLTIDYIGVLRKALDSAGLQHVQIVAADGSFTGISNDILKDSDLSDAVAVIGAHYPGTVSSDGAKNTEKKLWASEDFSTFNDDVGAGCWARILNQNYINGQMTSTISWNLIASYYNGLPFFRDGLMTAIEPWSGHFDINGPIYISAHTTQFTKPGDYYLPVGSGSGHLNKGGSYVSFIDSKTKDLTIVIETMSHDHSKCIRPSLPMYNVDRQTVTFKLQGTSFSKITQLYRWDSQLFNTSDGDIGPQYFIKNGTVRVINNEVSVDVPVDHVMTLSTKTGQVKGTYESPPSQPFPVPYIDNFDKYNEYSEADNFADQYGVYEIATSKIPGVGKVMKQVVPEHVISWCGDAEQTITLIGNNTWRTVSASVELILPEILGVESVGGFLAGCINKGGCQTRSATGVFLWINTNGSWSITSDLGGTKVIKTGSITVKTNTLYKLSLDIQTADLVAYTVQLDTVIMIIAILLVSLMAGMIN